MHAEINPRKALKRMTGMTGIGTKRTTQYVATADERRMNVFRYNGQLPVFFNLLSIKYCSTDAFSD
jgi:hypothetical protein